MVGRELTKVHQEFLRGTALEVLARLKTAVKGEFTVVIGPITKMMPKAAATDSDISQEFDRQTSSGAPSRRAALAATAKQLGLSARDVYAAVERAKNR